VLKNCGGNSTRGSEAISSVSIRRGGEEKFRCIVEYLYPVRLEYTLSSGLPEGVRSEGGLK